MNTSENMNTLDKIKQQIANNNVILYMKGTPQFPMCGFSSRVVKILSELRVNYAYVNVLDNPDIRAELPKYADWPTFPQLYIAQELVGGCDIVTELAETKELTKLLLAANAAIAGVDGNSAVVEA
jgi:monothiol glutaredoxin